jgi:hypothetical protein
MFRTVLFLGFGLTDPNFMRVFGEVGWLASGYQGDAFSIMAHTTKPEREEWQRRRLRVMPITNYEELTPFLDDLADKVVGIGNDVVVINALNHDFESPREFLNINPFFQISSKWQCEFVREQLHTTHAGFSANLLDSEEVWEPYKITFQEIGISNHLLVTITDSEILEIPESFWSRMPCGYEMLMQHVIHDKKIVFGVQKNKDLYTLLVVAAGPDRLKTAMADFLALKAIPKERTAMGIITEAS